MIAPLYKLGYFGFDTSLVIAFLVGLGFGYILESSGFGNSRKLAYQFYLKDMAVLKVMFTAIVVAMVGLLYLNWAELLDLSLVYVPPTVLNGQIIGGVLMGMGFVIGGFCPGTSLVASAIGKIDALFYVAGALFGMWIFGEVYPLIESVINGNNLGRVTVPEWLGWRPGVVAFLIILMAWGLFKVGELIEKKYGEVIEGEPVTEEPTTVDVES